MSVRREGLTQNVARKKNLLELKIKTKQQHLMVERAWLKRKKVFSHKRDANTAVSLGLLVKAE